MRRLSPCEGDTVIERSDGLDPLWSLEQVCEFLQLPLGTARKQRAMGRFVPGYRLGNYLRFRRSAVLAWLEEHADET
jgi:predicted DNA-binding transcriptional regulator AlpA